jgi:predicted thioesterase
MFTAVARAKDVDKAIVSMYHERFIVRQATIVNALVVSRVSCQLLIVVRL